MQVLNRTLLSEYKTWESFIRTNAHILRRGNDDWSADKILLQLAIEHADDSPVTRGAETYLAEGKCGWAWLRRERRLKHVGIDPCVAVFEGHDDKINGVLMLSDRRILSWSDDGTLRIWDMGGVQLALLEGHSAQVIGAQLLPDGEILSWSADRTLRLWDREGNPLQELKGHRAPVLGALIIPDGRILSWSDDKTLHMWEKNGTLQKVLSGHLIGVGGVVPLSDGRFLSWEGRGCNYLNHADVDEGIASYKEILSPMGNHTLRIWSLEGESQAVLLGHTNSIIGVQILPNKQILTWSWDGDLRLWDYEGNSLAELKGHTNGVDGVLLLANGQILSWAGIELLLWSSEGKLLKELKGHTALIRNALQLPDGKILSCSDDSTLRLWTKEGEIFLEMNGHEGIARDAQLLPDGRILSWSNDNTLRLWSQDGKLLSVLEGHEYPVEGIIILSNGRIITWTESSSDNEIRQWDNNGKPLNEMRGHTNTIRGTRQLSNGKLLSWSDDKTLRLWDNYCVEMVQPLECPPHEIKGFLPLSDDLFLTNYLESPSFYFECNYLYLWDHDGMPIAKLFDQSMSSDVLQNKRDTKGALLLPNSMIMTWHNDGAIRILSLTGNVIRVLSGHVDNIVGAELLPNGNALTWSDDKTLRVWNQEGIEQAVYDSNKLFEAPVDVWQARLSNKHIKYIFNQQCPVKDLHEPADRCRP